MQEPRQVHWNEVMRVLSYIKGSPGKGLIYSRYGHLLIKAYSDVGYGGDKDNRRSTSGYCTFVGGNLVTWRSKKQNVVSKSSVKAEYRAMSQTASEIVWLKNLLTELGVQVNQPIQMHCNNQAAIHRASNHTFHERTKHIEIDCRYVDRDLVVSGAITTPYTKSSDQTADIFTKALAPCSFNNLCNKLGLLDVYAPT